MGYLITDGHLYVALEHGTSMSFTIYFQQAHVFSKLDSASNYIICCMKNLNDFYVVDSEKRERIANVDNKKIEETKSKHRKFNDAEKKIIYKKTNGRCALCGQFMNFDEFTVDHIIPLAKGGTNNMDNLQAACLVCNRIKQDILPQDLIDKIGEIFIYNMGKDYRTDLMKEVVKLHKLHNRKSLINFIRRI